MAPLKGLTDLYQSVPSPASKSGGHTESQGGPVNAGFGARDPNVPYAYWAGPPPNENTVFGQPLADPGPVVAGIEGPASLIDRTPGEVDSHAAPYPRQMGYGNLHSWDEQHAEQEARRAIKRMDLGGPEKVHTDPQGFVQPATWVDRYEVTEGITELDPLPRDHQVTSSPLGGSGNAKNRIDPVHGLGELGGYGSGAAHYQRYDQSDPVPYNRQWLNSSDRPIMVPRRGVQASYDGPDSPYGPLGDTTNNMLQGTDNTAVMTNPTPYNDPPNPATASAGYPGLEAPMINGWF